VISRNLLWTVESPDADLTVIAADEKDALKVAADYLDLDPDCEEAKDLVVKLSEEDSRAWRWVEFDSRGCRDNQVRDLDAVGVPLDRILVRETGRVSSPPMYWAVGARNEDWCRLPAGVLCGGPE
jgi:hypothetical protein